MSIKRVNRTLVLLCALVLGACASAPEPRPGAPSPVPASGGGDPDQLAANALRTWAVDRDPARALAAIGRAGEIAPQRADIVLLHARLCIEVRGCEPEPIEARLRKLDPPNGTAWLGVLARAQARRDTRAEQQILDAMSRAERFDLYWTTLVSRLTAVQSKNSTATLPITTALNETTQWLSQLALPAFKPISAACSPDRASDPAAAGRCKRIAEAMQRSDTTLVEGIGLGIAQRLAQPGSGEASQLEQHAATLAYQAQASAAIIQAQVEREKFSAQVLELMKKLRREQDVTSAILRWAGEPLTPQ